MTKPRTDVRIEMIGHLLQMTIKGEIDWDTEQNPETHEVKVFSTVNRREASYVIILSRNDSGSSDYRKKYVYQAEVQIVPQSGNMRVLHFERGVGKLFKYIYGGSTSEDVKAMQSMLKDLGGRL